MLAQIITIGDELLIGQTVDTNSSWIGRELSLLGIRVTKIISVQDEPSEIVQQLNASIPQVDLLILTGGLGPTKDDLTKHVLANYFGAKLVMNEKVLKRNEAYFDARNRPSLEVNRNQALVPDNCEVLFNNNGTAPGMWFVKNKTIVVSLPGVPYEMKALMTDEVIPRIKERCALSSIFYRTIQTTGIGESFLAEIIKDWEEKVRAEGFGLAYLPSPGLVKLRLTSYRGAKDKARIDLLLDELIALIPNYYFGEEEASLSGNVAKKCIENRYTLGTVESCTAGRLASEIVKTPGASAYFLGSLITYSYELKEQLVNVSPEVLNKYGAISKECIEQMALGGKETLGVDFCIATSGIAGPSGGTNEKPVGTVWIAVASPSGVVSQKFQFGNLRNVNIELTCQNALRILLKLL